MKARSENLAPQVLYADLIARGFLLRVDAGVLYIRPTAALLDADRINIAANKPALLALCREAELGRAEFAVWSAWHSKRERFGDTPPDDPREDAREASHECLVLHARYMALVNSGTPFLDATGGHSAAENSPGLSAHETPRINAPCGW